MFGGDYETPDGTGVRDYIHVVDLARGHIAALDALVKRDASFVVNLGTGQGYSVLDVVQAFEKASGKPVPYEIVRAPPGRYRACFADPAAAAELIGWRAQYGIERMCADHWRWQSQNPQRVRVKSRCAPPRRSRAMRGCLSQPVLFSCLVSRLLFWFRCSSRLLIVRFAHLQEGVLGDTDLAGVQKFHARPVPRIGGVGHPVRADRIGRAVAMELSGRVGRDSRHRRVRHAGVSAPGWSKT